ncbi:MAG: ATP-binding protein [Anaerolineae bacterium]|jgi:DNA helicase HerA-like ATPase|nr:ATP-binding protein [Anaerolineae bacterium]
MMDQENELDRFISQPRPARPSPEALAEARRLGIVVAGSLSRGLAVKLDRSAVVEGMAVGRYVVIRGQTGRRFFSIITDVALDSTNPAIEKSPPDTTDQFLSRVYQGTSTFGRLDVSPMLVLDPPGEAGDGREAGVEPRPVKTVPAHFSPVYEATEEDVDRVFGAEGEGHFYVGTPLDMENVRVHLDLQRLVERSSGVFGKSGTGKTFLTRTLLAGIIKQRTAVNLIFDMHNEYGWETQGEGYRVKGLRQLFPGGQVSVMTLDPESSQRRKSKVDFTVRIGYNQIEPEDVEMLGGLMGLTETQVGALFYLRRRLGNAWIEKLLAEGEADDASEGPTELDTLLEEGKLHGGTLGAIQRRLGLFRRFDFLVPRAHEDVVGKIMEYLDREVNVVLEFGRYGSHLEAYILVANYLTRRIHERYVKRKEAALGNQAAEPKALVITIEEAHKFLDPAIARQTIFGTIARELRKYNVTLLVVDQRPSGIDEEVMSQIGTRVTALLDNEADIRAVLTGVSGASELRQVLARLDTRQQALILGHAVPMPVVVQARPYGPELYAEVGYVDDEALKTRMARNVQMLQGEDDFEGFD